MAGFRSLPKKQNKTMPRIADPNRKLRGKLNLTIHPEIRDFAEQLAFKRRRSVSQLFEDLVEAEWFRFVVPFRNCLRTSSRPSGSASKPPNKAHRLPNIRKLPTTARPRCNTGQQTSKKAALFKKQR